MTYQLTRPLSTHKACLKELEGIKDYRYRYHHLIRQRLDDFSKVGRSGRERLFMELGYCILTPQSSGLKCDQVIWNLFKKGLLRDPHRDPDYLKNELRNTRFWKKKRRYLIKAWQNYGPDAPQDMEEMLKERREELGCNRDLRTWLRKELRGFGIGMKEASHFLRNIGYYEDIAILDRHIISCCRDMGWLEDLKFRNDRDYLEIESRMSLSSGEIEIPLEELDLIFWSARTGYIFK